MLFSYLKKLFKNVQHQKNHLTLASGVDQVEVVNCEAACGQLVGVLPVFLRLHSDGGGDRPICSIVKNQFSSPKDGTTKQDIDLEIKCFLRTSHIL